MAGWIPLYRELENWKWANDHLACYVFLRLLIKASHNEHSFKGTILKAGQVPIGLKEFSSSIGISIQNLRTAFKRLESTNEIKVNGTTKGTVITIVSWDKWQLKNENLTNKQQTSNKQVTNKQQTSNKQPTTTNNYKIKNNNKVKRKP